MKLKQRAGDFRVRELLADGYLADRGDFRVYRVTKRKLTTPEAVSILAGEAGIDAADIGVAGWKDRQAVTIQYMSVPGGRQVNVQSPEVRIAQAGFAKEPLSGEFSRGNAFELNVRALSRDDIRTLRRTLPVIREHGLVNYFDDQRFGNLTHKQGWIVKGLMLGEHERALQRLLTARSPRDDDRHRRFKTSVARSWGDWRACRDAAGRFGAHHSVFEHLARNPRDFAGAFTFVAQRTRLIHLFAWQSHLWNRAVADLVRSALPLPQRVVMESEEGALVTHAGAAPPDLARRASFPLPGEGLENVEDPIELGLLEEVLAQEGMVADQLRVENVSGFRLKGERRALVLRPAHMRVRPAETDSMDRRRQMVRVRFELPRGAYATLVVKRLMARPHGERTPAPRRQAQGGGGRPDGPRRDVRKKTRDGRAPTPGAGGRRGGNR